MLLYVRSEMAYDGHHQHAGDLYLLGTKTKIGTVQQDASAYASAPFAFALKSEYPEIAQVGWLWVNLIDEKALLQVREAGKTVRSVLRKQRLRGRFHVFRPVHLPVH
jgi:putative ABC transport system permease protein